VGGRGWAVQFPIVVVPSPNATTWFNLSVLMQTGNGDPRACNLESRPLPNADAYPLTIEPALYAYVIAFLAHRPERMAAERESLGEALDDVAAVVLREPAEGDMIAANTQKETLKGLLHPRTLHLVALGALVASWSGDIETNRRLMAVVDFAAAKNQVPARLDPGARLAYILRDPDGWLRWSEALDVMANVTIASLENDRAALGRWLPRLQDPTVRATLAASLRPCMPATLQLLAHVRNETELRQCAVRHRDDPLSWSDLLNIEAERAERAHRPELAMQLLDEAVDGLVVAGFADMAANLRLQALEGAPMGLAERLQRAFQLLLDRPSLGPTMRAGVDASLAALGPKLVEQALAELRGARGVAPSSH
jgi:hypothetical protein